MLHLVYKIVNSKTGRYYIGVHSTTDIQDGYMGSGTLMRRAVKKYGPANFERTILFCFSTKQEAFAKEAELVTFDQLNDPLCYNLVVGGNCGNVTTKERRAMFYPDAKESVIVFDQRYNTRYQYSFYLKAERTFVFPKNVNFFTLTVCNTISSQAERFLTELNRMFNTKQYHDHAVSCIKELVKTPYFSNNIGLKKEQWPETA